MRQAAAEKKQAWYYRFCFYVMILISIVSDTIVLMQNIADPTLFPMSPGCDVSQEEDDSLMCFAICLRAHQPQSEPAEYLQCLRIFGHDLLGVAQPSRNFRHQLLYSVTAVCRKDLNHQYVGHSPRIEYACLDVLLNDSGVTLNMRGMLCV